MGCGSYCLIEADACSRIGEQFHLIFTNTSRCASKHNVDVTMPRRCSRQNARENHPGDTAEEYYRRSLAIPFLDHLKSNIKNKFTSHSLLAIKCLSIIPSCFEAAGAASDDEVLEFFSSDIEFESTAKAESLILKIKRYQIHPNYLLLHIPV